MSTCHTCRQLAKSAGSHGHISGPHHHLARSVLNPPHQPRALAGCVLALPVFTSALNMADYHKAHTHTHTPQPLLRRNHPPHDVAPANGLHVGLQRTPQGRKKEMVISDRSEGETSR